MNEIKKELLSFSLSHTHIRTCTNSFTRAQEADGGSRDKPSKLTFVSRMVNLRGLSACSRWRALFITGRCRHRSSRILRHRFAPTLLYIYIFIYICTHWGRGGGGAERAECRKKRKRDRWSFEKWARAQGVNGVCAPVIDAFRSASSPPGERAGGLCS